MDYNLYSQMLKALSEPNRLKIVDVLSCGEMCACKLLDFFNLTQPTLSHHMKILIATGLVVSRKEGVWQHYSLDQEKVCELEMFIKEVFSKDENCVCYQDKIKKEEKGCLRRE